MNQRCVPTSRLRRARRGSDGVSFPNAAVSFARLVKYGKGGFDMWLKDNKGNWYMAGQEPIGGISEVAGSWEKDSEGGWIFLATTVSSFTGNKGNAFSPIHSSVVL